jgi:hypothetical protein
MTSNGLAITGPQPRLEPAGNACSSSTLPALCRLERLCRVDATAVTMIRQPLGPRFGYAFQLRQESSRTALLVILRPCARLQSRSWWFLPSLTRAIESGVERLTLATSGYALVDADRRQLVRPIALVDRDVSHLRIVRRIAIPHRSAYGNCPSFGVSHLVRSKGQ